MSEFYIPDKMVAVTRYFGDELVTMDGYARLERDGARDLDFWIRTGEDYDPPTFPLKTVGELYRAGWHIPITYVVDASGRPWKDDAHRGVLRMVEQQDILIEARNEHDKRRLQNLFSLSPEEPQWMRKARAAGWSPPDGV